ncbi:hypothetical protein N7463_007226 [Penicillium fimorum]|uniref:Uncharacterized protein n=1 Tax=Penicillium fimorum TaxID=1882269 RepID=A0A9X0C6X6_9EURO|nr:hypothetical protein N7463_007226 [Penicillium fimorum]
MPNSQSKDELGDQEHEPRPDPENRQPAPFKNRSSPSCLEGTSTALSGKNSIEFMTCAMQYPAMCSHLKEAHL